MYFLDTYAIIEYLKGNSKYVNRIEKNDFSTGIFQLMEVYYITLKEQNEDLAEKYFDVFSIAKVNISDETIKKAMKIRLEFQQQKKNISYVDAIGFQYARDNNLTFLTGDKEFKDLEGVEWIPSDSS
jgi:predicted nucleic acid-binding protein